jgi:predicted TIM-barrel fold metal-dependent hydrolase
MRDTRTSRGAEALPIVDAHHHLWDLSAVRYPWLTDDIEPHFMFGDYTALRQNYLPSDYLRDSAGQRIVATVHCEAEADRSDPAAETSWLERQHARYGFPNALVVWADFSSPACGAQLEAHLEASCRVRGVRCKPRLPERSAALLHAGDLDDPNWLNGLALLDHYGLSWDLRVPWWFLEAAASVAARYPSITIVLNHCGLPWQRDAEGLVVWRAGLRALAECPNVNVKLSELGLPERIWSEADNGPILREVIETFGPQRCLFASNFPVASMRVGYDRWVAAVKIALQGQSPDDRADVFARNARRVYRIEENETAARSPGANQKEIRPCP